MRYLKTGKKEDLDGSSGALKPLVQKYSLSHILSHCSDFTDQLSDLEELAIELGSVIDVNMTVLFTPKFHCELVGEGIEYSWGASTRMYRCQHIHLEISTANFEKLTTQLLSYITKDMRRKFSAKARIYMLTYQHKGMMAVENKIDESNNENKSIIWSYDYNEKIHKQYSSH